MAQVTHLHLAHTPPTKPIYAALFTSVKNAPFLRQQLVAGNTEFEYAFIDASMILSSTHVLAAVFRAIGDMTQERLKSRNVHSETVFNLSPNNNIADAFRRFGVTDATTKLLAIKVGGTTPDQEITLDWVTRHLTENVEGDSVPFSDESLARMADAAAIRKAYKLGAGVQSTGKQKRPNVVVNGVSHDPKIDVDDKDKDVERKELEVTILGMMALKGS